MAAPSPASAATIPVAPVALDPIPGPRNAPFIDPELTGFVGKVAIVVSFDATAPTSEIAKHLDTARFLPAVGGTRLARGTVDASRLSELEASPFVKAILRDRFVMPSLPPGTPSGSPRPSNPLRFPFDAPSRVGWDVPGKGPEVNMKDVVEFTGARRAWTQLGVDGTGVTIAIVDTGVDHGAFNLGNAAVARNAAGVPISFDPDGGAFAFTSIGVASFVSGGREYVDTSGTDPLIFIFDLAEAFGPYGPAQLRWSDPDLGFGATFPADMDITGIADSMSGTYRFGVLSEWHLILPFIYLDLFPVIVVDAQSSGVYDTVYIDLSFDYWFNGFSPDPQPDFSFADEPMLRPRGGNVIAARDIDGDGYADVSAGSLAYGLDIWGVEPTLSERYGVLPPVDAGGDHIVMVYDWANHGTSVAASAAGRESNHPTAGPGIAPGAKIMGVPIFFWGDILEGWLWSAGFDLVDDVSGYTPVQDYISVVRYGNWTYTGDHKADIISNSWGVSNWLTVPWFFQWPWYDVLTAMEDALMTPGYSDPDYPGTLIVHASGNGGAGYGTVTAPGFSSLALTVGASTSLDMTGVPFAGHHYDVMSWSARGPNAFGAPKPDLVMVGAYAYAAAPPWAGNGTGSDAFTLFGGTSQSTPLASATAAVAIDAYVTAHGVRPSPLLLKSILKSTALDLGYDPFVQGAGHADVYNAAAYALGMKGLVASSPATWDNVRPMIREPWAASSAYYGREIRPAPPEGPISDDSWFAGYVRPGGTSSAAFALVPATGTVSGTLASVWHTRIGTLARTGTTATIGVGWLEGYGALVPLARTDIPSGTDLMVVRASMPFLSFDPGVDYSWNQRGRIFIADWIDDGDGTVEPAEARIFNYGYNTGTTFEARVGFPNARITGAPLLWYSQVPAEGSTFASLTYSIQIEFYQRVPWTWISVPGTFSVTPASSATITAAMTVPANAVPGVYEGQILITPGVGNRTAIPVSVVVPRVLDGTALSASLTGPPSTQIYDPARVLGLFDWRWRYEAGDWRLWYVEVTDPEIVAVRVDVTWTDLLTDVDLWSLTPSAVPGDSTFSPCPFPCEGAFTWSTRTGDTEDWVIVWTDSSLSHSGPGLYGFALHNVLYDGGPAGQAVSGTASIAKLSPRGPLAVSARPGTVVSLPFTLRTGFDLHFVNWFNGNSPGESAFPARVEPAFVPSMASGAARTLWANFTVPADTPDGRYENFLLLTSNEISVAVRADILVDATSPVVTLASPDPGAFVRGATIIRATIGEKSDLRGVTFEAGGLTGALSMDPVSGTWSGSWNTATNPDGPVDLVVTAEDAAGNTATVRRAVTVDNTLPVVSLVSPSEGATIGGVTRITWSADDANLEAIFLIIDGIAQDVTGTTSYAWDTGAVRGGPHAIEVKAIDRAGNERSARIGVTVDNALLTTGLFAGIGIGLLVAGIVGVVVGLWWARRRKPPELARVEGPPPPPPAPPEPPAMPPNPPGMP